MFSKVIDKFLIEEKSANDKDYFSKIYEINEKYELNIGDKIYSIKYKNRGYVNYNLRIMDIKEKGLIVKDRFDMYFLKWKDEDGNILEIYPFYVFRNGINDKSFLKELTKYRSDFYKNNYRNYLMNFKNIKSRELNKKVKQTSFLNIV